MYAVWMFVLGFGWRELGTFVDLHQVERYMQAMNSGTINKLIDDVLVGYCDDHAVVVGGENNMVRQLFNLGNQPS